MNVIVIVVDTLRYDHVAFHGNTWIKTPNLDRLASESWVFDRSFTASFPTLPHRTDALTGCHGSPFHAWMPLPWAWTTLPMRLAKQGYATQLIHDTPHLVNGGHNFDWPFHAWTFIRGAEVDRGWLTDEVVYPEHWIKDPVWDFVEDDGISDAALLRTYSRTNCNRRKDEDWNAAQTFRAAAQFVRDNAKRENFFLWVDEFDPHEPWDVPPDYAKMYADDPAYDGRIDPRGLAFRKQAIGQPKALKRLQAWYAGKVSWVDRWLGELLDALDETGLSRNTAVLLTADHGTSIGEWDRISKQSPPLEHEGHTPFIVRIPDGGSGRSSVIVQPQDIFATVMGITGGELPEGLDSNDVVALARKSESGPRDFALAGRSVGNDWDHAGRKKGGPIGSTAGLFTLFGVDEYLEISSDPADDRLVEYGTFANAAPDRPKRVQELHRAAIKECSRRGADERLIDWLRAEGKKPFPQECAFFRGEPRPEGYFAYFQKLIQD